MPDLNFGVDLILNVINRFILDIILYAGHLDQNNESQYQEQQAANNP